MEAEFIECANLLRNADGPAAALEVLERIKRLPVTIELLKLSSLGKVTNKWAKEPHAVPLAVELVASWRQLLKDRNEAAPPSSESNAPHMQRAGVATWSPANIDPTEWRVLAPLRPMLRYASKSQGHTPAFIALWHGNDGSRVHLQVTEGRAGSKARAEYIALKCVQLLRQGGTKEDAEALKKKHLQEAAAEAAAVAAVAAREAAEAAEAAAIAAARDPRTEDAPQGHIAWAKARFRPKQQICQFKYGDLNFQTTEGAAGSKTEAERIARICWLRFERGWTKEQVLQFREECYHLAGQKSGGDTSVRRVYKRAEQDSKELLVRKVVENFNEDAPDPPPYSFDTQKVARWDLPADSPIRTEHRQNYVFVAQTNKAGIFSSNPEKVVALRNWQFEFDCDLCGQSRGRELYALRCYARGQKKPHQLHLGIFYAGPKCTAKLLADSRPTPAQEAMTYLEEMLRGEDWQEQVSTTLASLESEEHKKFVMKIVEKMVRAMGGSTKTLKSAKPTPLPANLKSSLGPPASQSSRPTPRPAGASRENARVSLEQAPPGVPSVITPKAQMQQSASSSIQNPMLKVQSVQTPLVDRAHADMLLDRLAHLSTKLATIPVDRSSRSEAAISSAKGGSNSLGHSNVSSSANMAAMRSKIPVETKSNSEQLASSSNSYSLPAQASSLPEQPSQSIPKADTEPRRANQPSSLRSTSASDSSLSSLVAVLRRCAGRGNAPKLLKGNAGAPLVAAPFRAAQLAVDVSSDDSDSSESSSGSSDSDSSSDEVANEELRPLQDLDDAAFEDFWNSLDDSKSKPQSESTDIWQELFGEFVVDDEVDAVPSEEHVRDTLQSDTAGDEDYARQLQKEYDEEVSDKKQSVDGASVLQATRVAPSAPSSPFLPTSGPAARTPTARPSLPTPDGTPPPFQPTTAPTANTPTVRTSFPSYAGSPPPFQPTTGPAANTPTGRPSFPSHAGSPLPFLPTTGPAAHTPAARPSFPRHAASPLPFLPTTGPAAHTPTARPPLPSSVASPLRLPAHSSAVRLTGFSVHSEFNDTFYKSDIQIQTKPAYFTGARSTIMYWQISRRRWAITPHMCPERGDLVPYLMRGEEAGLACQAEVGGDDLWQEYAENEQRWYDVRVVFQSDLNVNEAASLVPRPDTSPPVLHATQLAVHTPTASLEMRDIPPPRLLPHSSAIKLTGFVRCPDFNGVYYRSDVQIQTQPAYFAASGSNIMYWQESRGRWAVTPRNCPERGNIVPFLVGGDETGLACQKHDRDDNLWQEYVANEQLWYDVRVHVESDLVWNRNDREAASERDATKSALQLTPGAPSSGAVGSSHTPPVLNSSGVSSGGAKSKESQIWSASAAIPMVIGDSTIEEDRQENSSWQEQTRKNDAELHVDQNWEEQAHGERKSSHWRDDQDRTSWADRRNGRTSWQEQNSDWQKGSQWEKSQNNESWNQKSHGHKSWQDQNSDYHSRTRREERQGDTNWREWRSNGHKSWQAEESDGNKRARWGERDDDSSWRNEKGSVASDGKTWGDWSTWKQREKW